MNTVPELFRTSVETYSRSIAIVDGDLRVSYSQLGLFVNRLSAYLYSLGIKKGDKVIILLPNSIEFVVSFFAISHLGAVSVPVSTAFKKEEIEFYIHHSGAGLILTDKEHEELLDKTSNPGVQVSVVKSEGAEWHDFDSSEMDPVELNPEDEAIYLYSTGSTGKPKRVARTHMMLLALADNHTSTVGWDESDRVLFTVPISHTYAFGNFISSVKIGAALVMLPEFNRRKVLELLQDESITIFPAVPVMLDSLSRTRMDNPPDLSSLKLVISAGAPLPEHIFKSFHEAFGIYTRQLYGSTETGVISINLGDKIEERWNSVGRAVENVEVSIVDDIDKEVKPGEVGEITVRSPSMATGYYGLPKETREVFKNGYYYTGDLGRLDDEGYIFIVGRKKLFINISGNKVDPGEVENVLGSIPDVLEAAVLGVGDEKGDEAVKAVLVTEGSLNKAEVLSYCRERLAGYKVPSIIEFTDKLPRSPSGKVLKEKLK